MKKIIGQTIKQVIVKDNKTVIKFTSGSQLVTLINKNGFNQNYFVYVDNNNAIIDLD